MEEDYRDVMAREDRITELENEDTISKSASVTGSAFPSVTGYINFSVTLDCPHCDNGLDLSQHPFDDDCDKYKELGAALFGGHETPAKWEGVDIEYECTHCGKSFLLGQLEY